MSMNDPTPTYIPPYQPVGTTIPEKDYILSQILLELKQIKKLLEKKND
jgi:hypothetical protein